MTEEASVPTLDELAVAYAAEQERGLTLKKATTQMKSWKTQYQGAYGAEVDRIKGIYQNKVSEYNDAKALHDQANDRWQALHRAFLATIPNDIAHYVSLRAPYQYEGFDPIAQAALMLAIKNTPGYMEKRTKVWYAFYVIPAPGLDPELVGVQIDPDIVGLRELYAEQAEKRGFPEATVVYRKVNRNQGVETVINVLRQRDIKWEE